MNPLSDVFSQMRELIEDFSRKLPIQNQNIRPDGQPEIQARVNRSSIGAPISNYNPQLVGSVIIAGVDPILLTPQQVVRLALDWLNNVEEQLTDIINTLSPESTSMGDSNEIREELSKLIRNTFLSIPGFAESLLDTLPPLRYEELQIQDVSEEERESLELIASLSERILEQQISQMQSTDREGGERQEEQ